MPRKASTPSTLEIHLLGQFRIAVDGQELEQALFVRRKPILLIKLLALQPHSRLHREQAMELLWPGSEPGSAVNNLHKAIYLARHGLEPDLKSGSDSHFILTKNQQVSVSAPAELWIDVTQFEIAATKALKSTDPESYEGALKLYEGDLLAEDLYEDWIAARRGQLRAHHQELLLKLAQLYEARHEYDRALERLKELVTSEPTNEDAHRKLMRLYALLGNKHQALRQYELCCEVLRKELSAEPDRDTAQLRQQILQGQFASLSSPGKAEDGRPPGLNCLAILPFANASADANAEYLSDGITESIINSLSQLPQLRIMARSTVFRYKGDEVDPQRVGRELRVGAVVTGRVLQHGEQLVIAAELVDTTDGTQLWGERYNRSALDIFELQEEIAREITQKLQLKLSRAEQGLLFKRHTHNTEAYRLYLKGRYFWNKRTLKAVEKSIDYFQEAIARDTDYALSYVGLADSYTKLGDVGVTAIPPREAFSKARTAAERALQCDGALAEAHASLGHLNLHDYQWSAAEREFKQAIELNPNYSTAHHWYAYLLLMIERPAEALTEINEALELDPLSLPINADYGELLYFARRYDQAIDQFHKTLEMDPHFYPAHIDLARVYEQQGMYEKAIAGIQKARDLSADSTDALAALAHTYAVSGQRKKALELLAKLNELAMARYISPYSIALVYAALDEKAKAFAWLQTAIAEHAAWIIYLKVDPKLDCLRGEPAFKELVRTIGLTP